MVLLMFDYRRIASQTLLIGKIFHDCIFRDRFGTTEHEARRAIVQPVIRSDQEKLSLFLCH
jgi:hypothetical protein